MSYLLVAAGVYIAVTFAFAVTSIVLGAGPSVCDIQDPMGLDVGDYLVGMGVVTLGLMALGSLYACIQSKAYIVTLSVISLLFSLAWFIVGGVILFRSNLECIHVGVPMVCFAVYMWASAAFGWFVACCGSRKTNE